MPDPGQAESRLREAHGGADRRLDFRPGVGMWWEITRSTQELPPTWKRKLSVRGILMRDVGEER
jgi:hypothetical protein